MKNIISMFLLLTCIMSCEQLIEVEDISNETIVILAPTDNVTINNTSVNFSWEAIEFAENYRLQIAVPNFENAQELLSNTLVTATNFNQELFQGSYQWRVRAENFSYQTQYKTQNLQIED